MLITDSTDDTDKCIFFMKQSPFSPSGEKVADRPDEGAVVTGNALQNGPLTPALTPDFFASTLPSNTTRKTQTNRGRGGNLALLGI